MTGHVEEGGEVYDCVLGLRGKELHEGRRGRKAVRRGRKRSEGL